MSRRPARAPAVVHVEELDAAVSELLDFGRAQGERLRTARREEGDQTPQERPDVYHLLADELRSALEDEIVPAVETEPSTGSGIVQWELDRELIKKALVGLKVGHLRAMARDRSLEDRGTSEELAERIARVYRWDEEEIARLVLENEPEPSPERGHVDRLFPLVAPPSPEDVERRLNYVAGRYIRVGVARWFVFDDATVSDESITVTGTVRAYQARVEAFAAEPTLSATSSEATAVLVMRRDEPLLVARGCTAQVARAAVNALRSAVRLDPLGRVPDESGPVTGAAALLEPRSLFILDLLANRLRAAGLGALNLTVARFKVGDTAVGTGDDGDVVRRPTLRAVRFEGDHLLDSAPACKLLAEEGRPLVDVAMHIDVTTSDDGPAGTFPVRIALEADHVSVMTGFGTLRPELSVELQKTLVDLVKAELREGVMDLPRLERLCERILERARTAEPVTRADILDEDTSAEDQSII